LRITCEPPIAHPGDSIAVRLERDDDDGPLNGQFLSIAEHTGDVVFAAKISTQQEAKEVVITVPVPVSAKSGMYDLRLGTASGAATRTAHLITLPRAARPRLAALGSALSYRRRAAESLLVGDKNAFRDDLEVALRFYEEAGTDDLARRVRLELAELSEIDTQPSAAGLRTSTNVVPTSRNVIAIKDLLEAGVQFGHQTRRWNPKMKPYIFGERNGIYIFDLGRTARLYREAAEFVSNIAADSGTVLFVGTKAAAQSAIVEEAQRCGMLFVNQRWLRGLLTNFSTVRRMLARLGDLEAMLIDDRYKTLSKKGNRAPQQRAQQACADPRRRSRHGPPAGCVIRCGHTARANRSQRSAQTQNPGDRRRRHELRSGRG
jgi:hypothetical protein